MQKLLKYSFQTYTTHLPLILLFSLSFIIALLIPVFAAFPTYNDLGGIFLRSTSLFTNLNLFTTAVIVFSTLFSLLFLSFAIVAINIIVKHSRTQTRINREVMAGLEKYTARVFTALLIFTVIVIAIDAMNYLLGISPTLSSIVGLIVTPFFFYAPAAIVIDELSIKRAMEASLRFFFGRLDYTLTWIVVAFVLVTLFDFIFIGVSGTMLSRYLLLAFNALFIMPYLIVLQSQAYMGRFSLLKR